MTTRAPSRRRPERPLSPSMLLAAVGACFGCVGAAAAQPVEATWLGGSGLWNNPAQWSLGGLLYPDNGSPPGTIYDVVIGASALDVIQLNVNAAVNSVDLQGGRLLLDGRALSVTDDISVGTNGQLHLFFGTVNGGTLNIGTSGTRLRLEGANNALNGVTINGNATLTDNTSAAVITNGLTMNGTMRFQNRLGGLGFDGDQALTGGTFIFDAASNPTDRYLLATAGSNVLFDSGVVVRGRRGAIEAPRGSGLLTSQGLISADVAGEYIRISGRFRNEGTLEAVNGGTLNLAHQSGTDTLWTNAGTLRAGAGSTLNLDAVFSLEPTTILDTAAGTVNLRGTLNNQGSTLALNAASGSWNFGTSLDKAVINGGSVTTSQGAQLVVQPSFRFNEFNGVAFDGSMLLNGRLALSGGSLNGTALLSSNSTLTTAGQWSSNAQLTATNSTLEFGGEFSFGPQFSLARTGGSVTLRGTLDNAGDVLTLNAATGSWSMAGDSFAGGTVMGGTVRFLDGAGLIPDTSGRARLAGVTLDGQLAVATNGGKLRVTDGITGGQIQLSGGNSILLFDGSQTVAGTTVVFGGTEGGDRRLTVEGAATLTLDPATVVRGGQALVGGSRFVSGPSTIINQGLIAADTPNQSLVIEGSTLINQGTLRAENGGLLIWNNPNGPAGDLEVAGSGSVMNVGGAFTLNGTTDISSGGRLSLTGGWSNTGTVNLAGGTLDLGGTFTTAGLGTVNRSGGVIRVRGTWNNAGDSIEADGVGNDLTIFGGIINGGTIDATNGARFVAAAGATNQLNSVTLNGPLDVTNATLLTTGLVLNGTADVTNGQLRLEGAWANNGVINLNNATLHLGGTVGLDDVGVINRSGGSIVSLAGTLNAFGETVTLSPTSLLTGISHPGRLNATTVELSGSPTFEASGGTIAAAEVSGTGTLATSGSFSLQPDPAVGGDTLTIGPGVTVQGHGFIGRDNGQFGGTVVNQGTIRQNGGNTMMIRSEDFVNEGLIEVSSGALRFFQTVDRVQATHWSNTGTIRLTGGALYLGGFFTTAGLGTLERTGGELFLNGVLDNTGDVLTLDASTGSWNINEGQINGGEITLAPGFNLLGGGTLNDVTFNGNPTLASQLIRGDLTVNGTLTTAGNLRFDESSQLAGTFVLQNGSMRTQTNQALTLTDGSTVRGYGTFGQRLSQGTTLPPNSLTNDGAIISDVSGQTLEILSQTFTNNGTIEATNGATLNVLNGALGPATWTSTGPIRATNGAIVELGGTFTLGPGQLLQTAGGELRLRGTMNLGGGSLDLDAVSGSLRLTSGRINDGTVNATGGAKIIVPASGPIDATLASVTMNGDIDVLGNPLTIRDSLTLNGTLRTAGAGSTTVYAAGPAPTLSGGLVELLGVTAATPHNLTVLTPGATLTIGPGTVVRGGRARIGDDRTIGGGQASNNIINNGRISADISGQTLDLMPDFLTNNGVIEALNGSTLNIGTVYPNDPSTLVRQWSGPGTVRTVNSTLSLGGRFPTSALSQFERTGGTVNLAGTLDNTGSTLTLDGAGQSWNLTGGVFAPGDLWIGSQIIGGTVNLLNGARLTAPAAINNARAVISGAAVNGNVDVQSPGGGIFVTNGGALNGTTTVSGAGGFVSFLSPATLTDGEFVFAGTTGQAGLMELTTATLGPDVVVRGGRVQINATSLVNQGRIAADAPGQFMTITAGTLVNEGTMEALNGSTLTLRGSWSSPGPLRAVGSTLELGGIFSASVIPSLQLTNANVRIAGSIDNSGQTLTLDGSNSTWALFNRGAVKGGQINLTNGARLRIESSNQTSDVATLEDASVNGEIDLAATFSRLRLRGALNLSGTMHMASPGVLLSFQGPATLATGTVAFEGGGTARTIAGDDSVLSTLTIAPPAVVRGGNGRILSSNQFATVFNQGRISADVSGQSIHIDTFRFVNTGTLEAINGGTLTYFPGPPGFEGPTDGHLQNSGLLRIGEASTITMDAPYVQTESGVLEFVLGGIEPGVTHGQMFLVDGAGLDGELRLALAAGFSPQPGDAFQIFAGEVHEIEGAFATLSLPALSAGHLWETSGLYTDGVVSVVPGPSATVLGMLAGLGACRRRRAASGSMK